MITIHAVQTVDPRVFGDSTKTLKCEFRGSKEQTKTTPYFGFGAVRLEF